MADLATNSAVTISGGGLPYQDYLIIGGMISPGKVTVLDLRRKSALDERKGYGIDGATVIFRGDDLATCSLHFEFWEAAQMSIGGPTPGSVGWFQFFNAWFLKVAPSVPGGILPFALGISHPVLNQFGAASWVVEGRTGLTQESDTGLWYADVHLKEFRRPKPALQKAIAAIPAIALPVPTAQDAQDKTIEALSATLTTLIP